jgi:diketogulonate reductase-like aldo/keto reductase
MKLEDKSLNVKASSIQLIEFCNKSNIQHESYFPLIEVRASSSKYIGGEKKS